MRATAAFDIDSWDEQPLEEHDGVKFTRARVNKTFRGDVDGTSVVEGLTALTPVESSRAYVAFERIACRLHGRAGAFLMQHCAVAWGDQSQLTLTIVPDSGTGDLAGITGTGSITIDSAGAHTLTLDYELPS